MRAVLIVAMLSLSLSACVPGLQRSETAVQGEPSPVTPVARQQASGDGEEASPAPGPRFVPSSLTPAQIQRVLILLDEAEQAMRKKNYTSPPGSDALSRYQAVLELIPDHQEATDGIARIAEDYLDWAYSALRAGDAALARRYLARARLAVADHPRALALEKALAGYRETAGQDSSASPSALGEQKSPRVRPVPVAPAKTAKRPEKRKPVAEVKQPLPAALDPALRELPLDVQAVRRRDPALEPVLASLADLVEKRNARIMIEAPRDADGRWLYQRLNARKLEYRIRANFRKESSARIILLD